MRTKTVLGILATCALCTACGDSELSLQDSNVPSSTSSPPTASSASQKRNGSGIESLQIDAPYVSPAGDENIHISLQLNDRVITSVTVRADAENPRSQKFQAAFRDGISTVIVGQSIDNLELTAVSGASLTTAGFMAALTKVRSSIQ